MKDIEIELSGSLTADKYQELIDFFDNLPSDEVKKKPAKHRILIDYSTFLGEGLKNRQKDIRLRVTNGQPEIIVKLGLWDSADNRKELSVLTQGDDFDTLVQIYAALGYKKGMLCERTTQVFVYHDIEFALVKMPKDYYLFEAEIMANENASVEQIKQKILNEIHNLGLTILSPQEYIDYIQELNDSVNEVFDFDKDYVENYFENRYHLSVELAEAKASGTTYNG